MEYVKLIIEFYLVFIIITFFLKFILTNRKNITIIFLFLIIGLIYILSKHFKLDISEEIYKYILIYGIMAVIIIMAPELRVAVEDILKNENNQTLKTTTRTTKEQIAEAVEYLASKKIGALITIERYTSLDQYSSRAIPLDAEVTKELLINIFTPLTPLHDGAVIIRGDKIVCAASYFILSETNKVDKTVGSRHRAALGISEVSDSLTIVVSEQTGNISIALDGILIKLPNKNKLLEYLDVI